MSRGGLLLSLCAPSPGLGPGLGGNICRPLGSRNGVVTSRCAGKRPGPPPGAARPSGSVGAGPAPSPQVTQAARNVPGLNGPCVKLPGGGAEPKNTPQGKARAQHWARARGTPWAVHRHVHRAQPTRSRGLQAPLSPVPSHSNTHFTTQAQDQGLHHHHTWSASHSSTSFQAPNGVGKGQKVNPISEMREQRLRGEVRGCPRRN